MTASRPLVLLTAMALPACDPGPSGAADAGEVEVSFDVRGDGADALARCPIDDVPGDGVVQTDRGAVRGARDGAVWSFLGVPYAAPPVGELRWRAPAPAACWSGALAATSWGPACPQSDAAGTAPVFGDEDCLRAQVWTRSLASDARKPVLVWIHGGGFTLGAPGQQSVDGTRIYDGARFVAREDVVVVSIGYRLGVLGWLAHPALDVEDRRRTSGNYGLLDQLAARRWVQRNGVAFGGDPSRVTIFGGSAGGVAVCALIASPLAKGLFARAIIESGGCRAGNFIDAETRGAKVVVATKCESAPDVAACLRALPAAQIVGALPAPVEVAGAVSVYGPIVDGVALTGAPLDVITAGGHASVPLVIGTNSEETSKAVPLATTASDAEYRAAVATLFPVVEDTVLAQYPSTDYASPWAAYVALTTDAKFVCPARRAARAFADGQVEPVFRYVFSHALDDAPAQKKLGAWHGVEALYVFDHLAVAGSVPSAAEAALAAPIEPAWARFADGGDPSDGASGPTWPAWDATDPYLRLDAPLSTGNGVRGAQCDFWDGLAR
ncbi:MAG: carboxylesterase/lipase family protein [Polyangiales bacterium]